MRELQDLRESEPSYNVVAGDGWRIVDGDEILAAFACDDLRIRV